MKLKVAACIEVAASRRSDGTDMCAPKMEDMAPIARQERRPNGAESKNLNVRVPLDVLAAAKDKAAELEETLSAAVVRFLREYAATEEGSDD